MPCVVDDKTLLAGTEAGSSGRVTRMKSLEHSKIVLQSTRSRLQRLNSPRRNTSIAVANGPRGEQHSEDHMACGSFCAIHLDSVGMSLYYAAETGSVQRLRTLLNELPAGAKELRWQHEASKQPRFHLAPSLIFDVPPTSFRSFPCATRMDPCL